MALPDDAALSAELMSFISLDHSRIEAASHWVSIASGIRSRPGYPQRNTALRHAEDRLLMQQERYAEAAERLMAREEEIRVDPIPLSRATELATLAHCLAKIGAVDRALGLAAIALKDAESMIGLSAGDYCMELICRTMKACDRVQEACSHARRHSEARNRVLPRPFAPFFIELSTAGELSRH